MKTKSKEKVKSKRDETVIEGQWRATARYGGSGREARRRRERGAEVTPASGRSETGANAEKGQSARRKEPVEEP